MADRADRDIDSPPTKTHAQFVEVSGHIVWACGRARSSVGWDTRNVEFGSGRTDSLRWQSP